MDMCISLTPWRASTRTPTGIWRWQYIFPAGHRSSDPRSGQMRRHHLDPSPINKAIARVVLQTGIGKGVSAHTFRHSFATHLVQRGTDIRTIQAVLGHTDISTTMIYTHVLQQGGHGVTSPLDDLALKCDSFLPWPPSVVSHRDDEENILEPL